ncbi:MAG: hypothetical protein LBR38_08225 [Synergistaceae bacterium]|nr:hypothetical protein [Synergistaceae bacterium]
MAGGNISERLVDFVRVTAKGADFIALSKLSSALQKELTGKAKPTSAELAKALGALDGELTLKKVGTRAYIVFRMPDDILLFRVIQRKGAQRVGKLGQNIPFKKDEYISVLNVLLARGQVKAIDLNSAGVPMICPVDVPDTIRPEPPEPTGRDEAFLTALRDGLKHNAHTDRVAIGDLRRKLGWPRDEFDDMLRRLRDTEEIQLHASEGGHNDPNEVFVDENGFIMDSVSLTHGRRE